MTLENILLILIVASWLYWLIACWMVHVFFTRSAGFETGFSPPVSILKPLKGLDAQAYQNFASFCQQDYPEFELLFGVSDPRDPVIHLVRRLQREYPYRDIRLVIASPIGSNRKVSLLHHLAQEARHEVLVISDSDMRVTPDYLKRVVAPLSEEKTGLVTCLYRGEMPLTLTARLEALYIGASFLPSVIVARRFLNMRFALGASVVLRSRDLARMGGFEALVDYLADDYQIGARMAHLSLRVHLSDYIVSYVMGATSFLDQWQREVRWARCSRVSRPREYPGLILTFSTPLSLVLLVVSGFNSSSWMVLVTSMLLRWIVAWLVTGYTQDRETRRWSAWLPVRDVLTAIVWCAGGIGQRVVWRGEEFILVADGRMQPLAPAAQTPEATQ